MTKQVLESLITSFNKTNLNLSSFSTNLILLIEADNLKELGFEGENPGDRRRSRN